EILIACIILSTASVAFKFIANRLYADILSTLNFFCGVSSLLLTHNGYFARAIIVIIAGQLFDLFDGRMAEKHGGTKYGPYLDDIADFVSFGIAPAYVMVKLGSQVAWVFAVIFVAGVAYRLVRFVTVDKKRTDLPDGVFNGLPSPAGALVVLGASIAVPPSLLYVVSVVTVALMVSRIQFAHFGRLIIRQVPRPLFFLASAMIIIGIAYVLKTRSVHLFGYMILVSTLIYMVVGRRLLKVTPPTVS
ncbi:MAG TPA: CDP-alcohol phosphatidyltransferase family protein, partial [Desulfopila sp.]|nr:CDP-alcohol phosphatidyltransferase family protein [Desulfopila sp.]